MPYADPKKAHECMVRYRESHREEMRAQHVAWKKANPRRWKAISRKSHLKRMYGITHDDFEMLLVRQRGACAVCGSWEPQGRNGRWHIDHCHDSERIRGLLCDPCNRGIGMLQDSRLTLLRAAAYLGRFDS
jgi:hypothetical protein